MGTIIQYQTSRRVSVQELYITERETTIEGLTVNAPWQHQTVQHSSIESRAGPALHKPSPFSSLTSTLTTITTITTISQPNVPTTFRNHLAQSPPIRSPPRSRPSSLPDIPGRPSPHHSTATQPRLAQDPRLRLHS